MVFQSRRSRLIVVLVVAVFLFVNWKYSVSSGSLDDPPAPVAVVATPSPETPPVVSGSGQSNTEKQTAGATAGGSTLLPLEPFRCAARRATMHVPRNRSDYQVSPSGAKGAMCCTPVKDDIDKGLTMYHLLTRYLCTAHRSAFRVKVDAEAIDASLRKGDAMARVSASIDAAEVDPAAAADGGGATGSQRVRVLQIGANTGDNENDHLFRFLRQKHWAEAVLVEPVPWLFERLSAAYKDLAASGVVTLVNAAVGTKDGTLPFFAPLPDAPGWVKQMGGFKITPRNMNVLKKKKMTKYIKETSVTVKSVGSVLNVARPSWRGRLPHVVVIDTEGFDASVVAMLLDEVLSMRHELAESGDGEAAEALAIPVIQYEWKHLSVESDDATMQRLRDLGYCVLRVHYDTLAYHARTFEGAGSALQCDVGFDVSYRL